MKTLPLPDSWQARALVVEGGEAQDAWFTGEEMQIANDLRLPKRRAEWLLSRAAAKQLAVQRGFCASPRDLELTRRRVSDLHISLSHSEPFAAAAVDFQPIGIDVQTVRELREAAAHFFLTDAETERMQRCTTEDRLIHWWSAKEAAWKRLEGSVETLKRVPIHLEDAGQHWTRFDSVETIRIGDLVVALTRPTF